MRHKGRDDEWDGDADEAPATDEDVQAGGRPWRAMSRRERLQQVERVLVRHSRFKELYADIDYCAQYGAQDLRSREPPCLAVLGETGAGKSTLVETWVQDQPRPPEANDRTITPYLLVTLPAATTVKGAAEVMLRALRDPNAPRGSFASMQARLHEYIDKCGVQTIFIDEFQHIFDHTTARIVKVVVDFLKDLVKVTRIPLILTGKLEASDVLQDPDADQLARLVGSPQVLRPFPWDRTNRQSIKDFRSVMRAIDNSLPLDPSGLGSVDMAWRFHYATDGYLGSVMELVRHAASEVIKADRARSDPSRADRETTITLGRLRTAYEKRIAKTSRGFVEPPPEEVVPAATREARALARSSSKLTPQRVPKQNPFTEHFLRAHPIPRSPEPPPS